MACLTPGSRRNSIEIQRHEGFTCRSEHSQTEEVASENFDHAFSFKEDQNKRIDKWSDLFIHYVNGNSMNVEVIFLSKTFCQRTIQW